MRSMQLIPIVVATFALAGCALAGSSGVQEQTTSPLQDYLAPLYDSIDREKLAAIDRDIEVRVAACMEAAGFRYTPAAPTTEVLVEGVEGIDPHSGLRRDSREYAERYGYGVSTFVAPEQPEPVDPNGGYVGGLTDSAREAYVTALYGSTPNDTEVVSDPSVSHWEQEGCYGRARHESGQYSALRFWNDPQFQQLTQQVIDLHRTSDSPAVNAAQRRWSACMQEQGYPGMHAQEDARSQVVQRFNQELFPAQSGDQPPSESPAPSGDQLAEFTRYEIALAVADFDCADRSGVTAVLKREEFERERVFVAEHRAELDALVERYARRD